MNEKIWVIVSAMSTIVIAGSTLLYCIFAGKQWFVMDKQLEQMKIGYRPWIGLDNEQPSLLTGSLTIDKDKNISGFCRIVSRNFGNYPAQNVFAGAELVVTQNTDSVREREKKLCEDSIPANIGNVVFPGANKVAWSWPLHVTKDQMISIPEGGSQFSAFIVGCIFYRDQFEGLHHTGFAYQLKKPNSISSLAFEPIPNTTIEGQWVEVHGFAD